MDYHGIQIGCHDGLLSSWATRQLTPKYWLKKKICATSSLLCGHFSASWHYLMPRQCMNTGNWAIQFLSSDTVSLLSSARSCHSDQWSLQPATTECKNIQNFIIKVDRWTLWVSSTWLHLSSPWFFQKETLEDGWLLGCCTLLLNYGAGSKHLWKAVNSYETAWCNSPENRHLHTHNRENPKSHLTKLCLHLLFLTLHDPTMWKIHVVKLLYLSFSPSCYILTLTSILPRTSSSNTLNPRSSPRIDKVSCPFKSVGDITFK